MKTERSSTSFGSRTLTVILSVLLIVSVAANGFLLWKTVDLGNRRSELSAGLAVAAAANEALNAQLLEAQSAVNSQPDADAALVDLQAEFDAYKADSQAAYAALEAEFAAYQTNAQSDLAAAKSEGDASTQAAKDDAAAALAALQAEYDAATAESGAAYTALADEYAQLKSDAEQAAADAAAAGDAALMAAQADADTALAALQTEFDAFKRDAQDAQDALQAEFTEYKTSAELALADAASASEADAQAEQALKDLQASFDAYKTDADTKYAALSAEFDAYQAEADGALTAAVAAGDARVLAAQASADEGTAALQSELDAYKQSAEADAAAARTEADAALAAVQQELDAYKQTAEADATARTETGAALAAAQQAVADMQQTIEDTEKSLALASVPADENGAGNGANGMLALLYRGNIYYHNNYNHGNIYVENTEGLYDEYQSKTDSDPIYQMNNILGGYENYLYYRNKYRIYRVNLDTGHIDTVVRAFYIFPQSGLQAIGTTLYFLNYPYNGEGELRDNLWHMDPKGQNLQSVPGVRAGSFAADGQYLYYTALDQPALVRLDPADGSRQTLLDGAAAVCLNLSGDTIYFSLDGQLTKLGKDGAGLALVGGARGEALNVVGDWIYYANTDDNGTLYRITTGGLYNEKLCDVEDVGYINIAGGWVYFLQYDVRGERIDVANTYKMRLDGTDLSLARP